MRKLARKIFGKRNGCDHRWSTVGEEDVEERKRGKRIGSTRVFRQKCRICDETREFKMDSRHIHW